MTDRTILAREPRNRTPLSTVSSKSSGQRAVSRETMVPTPWKPSMYSMDDSSRNACCTASSSPTIKSTVSRSSILDEVDGAMSMPKCR
ncbi:hypothetical protein B0T17DRAFT_541770 [Bombardia bombarda]|uniref:Uncharacterized protein n=1 Tax=Bombardia bombarda TaxID=252184 RepID=A0AA39WAW4_9PEZI|nr:hypothetical protein B0T17DRAFT_541770 [Bombardia bombarda]